MVSFLVKSGMTDAAITTASIKIFGGECDPAITMATNKILS